MPQVSIRHPPKGRYLLPGELQKRGRCLFTTDGHHDEKFPAGEGATWEKKI